MTHESFELYLRDVDLMSEHETKEVVSRISWIETTLNVSVEKMMESDSSWASLQQSLNDLVMDVGTCTLFLEALEKYRTFMAKSFR